MACLGSVFSYADTRAFEVAVNSADNESNRALEKRVEELETIVRELKDNKAKNEGDDVNELLLEEVLYSYEELSEAIDKGIKIAGYADVEYRGSNQDGINEEFRMHHLSLFFTKSFKNNFKFFSEIEYEDAPKIEGTNNGSGDLKESAGKIFVEAMNFDWNYSQNINVRIGRFFTPAGIWSEDHYPPFVETQERPLHIRKVFPQLVDGLAVLGRIDISDNTLFSYNAFLGNGESNVSGKKDLNSSKAVGFRGEFDFSLLDEFLAGFTLYSDGQDSVNNDVDNYAYGYHLKIRNNNLMFQFEYASSDLDSQDASLDYGRDGYYGQISYGIRQWRIGYRYDIYDQNSLNIEEIERNSLFVNYHVNEHITTKAEYHHDDHNDPSLDSFGSYIFSITAFLGGR